MKSYITSKHSSLHILIPSVCQVESSLLDRVRNISHCVTSKATNEISVFFEEQPYLEGGFQNQ